MLIYKTYEASNTKPNIKKDSQLKLGLYVMIS